MKVCFAFNHFNFMDGITRTAIGIANVLESRGIEVTLCPLFRYDKRVKDLLNPGVRVRPVFGFYFRGMSHLAARLPQSFLYKKVFGGEAYDVEVAFQFGLATRIVAESPSKAAHWGWMHGYDYDMEMKDCYLRMDRMICVSRCNAERLRRDLDGRVPVESCYNPIDDARIRRMGAEVADRERDGSFLFVSVGRLSPEKGFDRLIRSVATLRREGFACKLWLVGDGDERGRLEALIRQEALGDAVILLGKQSNPHRYTAKADLFVCSSTSEGYSTACTEAIMLGVPVLSTNVSGAEEMIGMAEAGMVVENSADALRDAMRAVLEHPETVKEWKNRLAGTRERFSCAVRAEKLLELFGKAGEQK